MTHFSLCSRRGALSLLTASLCVLAVACDGGGPSFPGGDGGGNSGHRGPAVVSLGLASGFAVLAKAGVSTIPTSAIRGDVGVSPIDRTGLTGFSETMDSSNQYALSPQVTGRLYASDYTDPTPANLTTAVSNMETAFTDAAGRTVPAPINEYAAGDLSGQTLAPAIYKFGTGVLINTDVTLNGGPNDVWIFQVAGAITQASNTRVTLTGGALARNVFWQVFGPVAIGTGAHFEGTVLCQTNISIGTGASVLGRLLAQTAVTLDAAVVGTP